MRSTCLHPFHTVGFAKSLLAVDGLPRERQVRAAFAAALGGTAAAVGAAVPAAGGEAAAGVLEAHLEFPRLRPLPGGGAWLPLETTAGEVLGAALCSATGSQQPARHNDGSGASGARASSGSSRGRGPAAACRPVFVSVGHKVSLSTALAVVQRCCRHRCVASCHVPAVQVKEGCAAEGQGLPLLVLRCAGAACGGCACSGDAPPSPPPPPPTHTHHPYLL